MKCPVCSNEMVGEDFGGVMVDCCNNGCKGIWFDWNELSKLDELNEGLGSALQKALTYERTNDDGRGKINCPKCQIPMHIHKYEAAKEINVDECYQCGGFFLDSGELKAIRDDFMSDAERDAYMQKLLDNAPAFNQAQKDLEKEKLRTEAVKRMTRFFRASYYITKK